MMEDYLKRLENLITPHSYTKNNIKGRLEEETTEVNLNKPMFTNNTDRQIILNQDLNSDENKKLIDEYLQKMGIKDVMELGVNNGSILGENRVKIYQKILENEGKFENPEVLNLFNQDILTGNFNSDFKSSRPFSIRGNFFSDQNINNKTYSLSPTRRFRSSAADNNNISQLDNNSLREKIHQLNIKTMNYRHEVEVLKSKITELNKTIESQDQAINKLERQKESSNKYLLKLEAMLAQSQGGSAKNSLSFLNMTSNPSSPHRQNNQIKLDNPNFSYSSYTNNANTQGNMLSPTNLNTTVNRKPNINETVHVEINHKTNNILIEDKLSHTVMNIADKHDLREYIINLVAENQKLKLFQNQVFEISKNYDDINENVVETMKNLQNDFGSKEININQVGVAGIVKNI
jgi:hypothetical protein